MADLDPKTIIVDFLSWPKDKQLIYLADTTIADISIRRYKKSKIRREQSNSSRRRKAADMIHNNFGSLISSFSINLKTGQVHIKGFPDRKPGRTNQGYLLYVFMGRSYLCHRLVMMKAIETFIPAGKEVDHINSKNDDNRIENLRLVDPKKNKAYWQHLKAGNFEKMDV